MNIGVFLTRFFLRAFAFLFPLYESGESPIRAPENKYRVFHNGPPSQNIQEGIVKAYQEAFKKPPWNEMWTGEQVVQKMRKELRGDSFLTVMEGNKEWPVGGVCWGALASVRELSERAVSVLGNDSVIEKKTKRLEEFLIKKEVKRILFLDDILILGPFRGGIDPIRFLLLPGLEMSIQKGVKAAIGWSTVGAKSFPFASIMGFEPVMRLVSKKKEIVFLFHPNIQPLLKIAQNVPQKQIGLLMKVISRSR